MTFESFLGEWTFHVFNVHHSLGCKSKPGVLQHPRPGLLLGPWSAAVHWWPLMLAKLVRFQSDDRNNMCLSNILIFYIVQCAHTDISFNLHNTRSEVICHSCFTGHCIGAGNTFNLHPNTVTILSLDLQLHLGIGTRSLSQVFLNRTRVAMRHCSRLTRNEK